MPFKTKVLFRIKTKNLLKIIMMIKKLKSQMNNKLHRIKGRLKRREFLREPELKLLGSNNHRCRSENLKFFTDRLGLAIKTNQKLARLGMESRKKTSKTGVDRVMSNKRVRSNKLNNSNNKLLKTVFRQTRKFKPAGKIWGWKILKFKLIE